MAGQGVTCHSRELKAFHRSTVFLIRASIDREPDQGMAPSPDRAEHHLGCTQSTLAWAAQAPKQSFLEWPPSLKACTAFVFSQRW